MGYLRYFDYVLRAQDANIQQWIAKNMPILYSAERTTQQQITSRLTQKYDLTDQFRNTTVFAEAPKYTAGSLVELNYTAYSLTAIYTAGTYISWTDGNIYRCIGTTTAGTLPSDVTKFTKIGAQYDLYFIDNPYPLFNVLTPYFKGDRVLFKNKIYECKFDSLLESHYDKLQDGTTFNAPLPNYFPDDVKNGALQWGVGTAYSVTGYIPNAALPTAYNALTVYTAGNLVSFNGLRWKALIGSTGVTPGSDIVTWQSEYWAPGDNRDTEIVMYYVDIVIYNLMPRIAPMGIPKNRLDNYNIAMAWLRDAAKGDVSPNLRGLPANKGSRVRWGSQTKQRNGY